MKSLGLWKLVLQIASAKMLTRLYPKYPEVRLIIHSGTVFLLQELNICTLFCYFFSSLPECLRNPHCTGCDNIAKSKDLKN